MEIQLTKDTHNLITTINQLRKVPVSTDELEGTMNEYLEGVYKDILDGMYDPEDLR